MYSTYPLIRTPKGISVLFELTNVRIIGIKTLLNQGTWQFVRNYEKFELSGIRINGYLVLYFLTFLWHIQFELAPVTRTPALNKNHLDESNTNTNPKQTQHNQKKKTNSRQHVNKATLNDNTRLDTSVQQDESILFEKQLATFVSSQAKEMEFPPHLTPKQRALVHEKAEEHGLVHVSKGDGVKRRIVVSKIEDSSQKTKGANSS